jgi:hypothetical protein
MTLQQILRGPYHGVLAGGSCESLEALPRRRVSAEDDDDVGNEWPIVGRADGSPVRESVEPMARDKEAWDSPGKRMAERWLSDRERREGLGGSVGRQMEQAFL